MSREGSASDVVSKIAVGGGGINWQPAKRCIKPGGWLC